MTKRTRTRKTVQNLTSVCKYFSYHEYVWLGLLISFVPDLVHSRLIRLKLFFLVGRVGEGPFPLHTPVKF